MRGLIAVLALLGPISAVRAQAATASSNAEMTAMFDADQSAREHQPIDWNRLLSQDAARRVRTQALLDAGQLHSGDDYLHAAFVFQHGDLPADFLKAHTLAVIALARGKADAAWIAAATLDRYLQKIGQPQIYGTQYSEGPDRHWTQEPYQRDFMSDALRQAAGVKTLAQQEAARQEFERKFAGTDK